jgi:general secretion pathway protein D
MLLESGNTAVIGGLRSDTDTKTVSKVPFLGDIPIIGELFKFRSKNRDQRSLMVFITPTIVYSSADTQTILEQELKRRKVKLKDELDELLGMADAPAAN